MILIVSQPFNSNPTPTKSCYYRTVTVQQSRDRLTCQLFTAMLFCSWTLYLTIGRFLRPSATCIDLSPSLKTCYHHVSHVSHVSRSLIALSQLHLYRICIWIHSRRLCTRYKQSVAFMQTSQDWSREERELENRYREGKANRKLSIRVMVSTKQDEWGKSERDESKDGVCEELTLVSYILVCCVGDELHQCVLRDSIPCCMKSYILYLTRLVVPLILPMFPLLVLLMILLSVTEIKLTKMITIIVYMQFQLLLLPPLLEKYRNLQAHSSNILITSTRL